MDFIDEEKLYRDGRLIINGKNAFKYADIIVSNNDEYYHAIFLKYQNFFTITMDDYQTFPTLEIASIVLKTILKADIMMAENEKPDNDKLSSLLEQLNPNEKYYKLDNYIIRIGDKNITTKKATFSLDSNILVSKINICVTNMSTMIEAEVDDINRTSLDKYDRLFSLSVNNKITFKELVCMNALPQDEKVILTFVSEQEYYLKHSMANSIKMTGNQIWALQVMEYTTNIGRDNPIEIRYGSQSINVGKKRFFLLFSIEGVKISKDIRFGLVTFSNESGIDIGRETEFNKIVGERNDCYAQVVIVNESLGLAVQDALSMVDKAINLLNMILLDDSARDFFGVKDTYRSWDSETLNLKVSVNDYFYIEDVIESKQYAMISRKKDTLKKPIEIDDQSIELLNKENLLEDFFYLNENKEAEDLLQAIIWLNASRKAIDIKERVISLYNSIEFLLSGESGKTLAQELYSSYGDEYNQSIDSINQIVENIQNVKLRERMKGIMTSSFTGSASVKSKLETLVERFHITFSEGDWNLFNKLKNNRHKLLHNKKINTKITNRELNELYHIFAKLIVYKINALISGGNND